MTKSVGTWPRPWRRCQGSRGVAKAVAVSPRPWGRGQCLEGVVKNVRAIPSANPKAVGA